VLIINGSRHYEEKIIPTLKKNETQIIEIIIHVQKIHVL